MTQSEFTLLNEVEQEEMVWDNGIFVATHQNDDLMYDLYSLGDFYVRFAYKFHDYKNVMISTFSKVGYAELNPVQ